MCNSMSAVINQVSLHDKLKIYHLRAIDVVCITFEFLAILDVFVTLVRHDCRSTLLKTKSKHVDKDNVTIACH